MLQETSQLLSKTEMQKLVSRLNGDDHRQALATEWELVVFFAFSNLGTVQYEPELGGKKQPDIAFTLFGDNEISFVADVTTVSDRGLEEANPLERLSKELIRLVEKLQLEAHRFGIEVGSGPMTYKGGPKIKWCIPPVGDFQDRIFNAEFKFFLNAIREEPNIPRSLPINGPSVSLQIRYKPDQRYFMSLSRIDDAIEVLPVTSM